MSSKRCVQCNGATRKYDRCYLCRNNRSYDAKKKRNYNLKRRYGISSDEFDALFKRQGSKCGICQRTDAKQYVCDHDHTTGAVRGILCRNCNSGIGKIGDTLERARQAVRYLEDHNEKSS